MTLTATRRGNDEYDDPILSKVVKAGRRTYFFDVRTTRGDDCFLTITESRKMVDDSGTVSYDRHKIFLYKEDFDNAKDLRERIRMRFGGKRRRERSESGFEYSSDEISEAEAMMEAGNDRSVFEDDARAYDDR